MKDSNLAIYNMPVILKKLTNKMLIIKLGCSRYVNYYDMNWIPAGAGIIDVRWMWKLPRMSSVPEEVTIGKIAKLLWCMYLSLDESRLIPKDDIKSVGGKAYKDPFTKLWMEAGYFLYLRYRKILWVGILLLFIKESVEPYILYQALLSNSCNCFISKDTKCILFLCFLYCLLFLGK